MQLSFARKVVVVPGYGLAVAQAQHDVRQLAELLEAKGVDVSYAIHPVAGRMPGHMNVLLAEANVPYDQLKEMDEINPEFPQTDVALVIGANDVVNPAARSDPSSPIYGMPILDVDKAASVVVMKRSMAPGFAGIDNELFLDPRTTMLFGNAKDSIVKLIGVGEDGLMAGFARSPSSARLLGEPAAIVRAKVADRLNDLTRRFVEPLPVRPARHLGARRDLRREPARRPAGLRPRARRAHAAASRATREQARRLAPQRPAQPARRPALPRPRRRRHAPGQRPRHDRHDADLLAPCAVEGKVPKLGLRIEVDEVFTHCSKAFLRARLWDPETFVDRSELPSSGEMHRSLNPDFDAERYDAERAERYARREGFY